MATISTVYLIPSTGEAAGYETLAPLAATSSTITDVYASGIIQVLVQANGACTVDVKRSHLTNDVWNVYQTLNISNTSWFHKYMDVRVEKYQLVITSLVAAGGDDINVKGYMITYDGLSYATLIGFRDVTAIAEETVSDHYVCEALLAAYDKVNQHTGKTRASPWLTTDTSYEKIQRAQSMLAAHYCTIRGWDAAPKDYTKAAEIVTQWLVQYCLEIYDLTGEVPYDLPGMPESKSKSAMPFEASLKMVQVQDTDGDSYTTMSTR